MAPDEIELDEPLKTRLNRLRRVPALSPEAVAEERAKFLSQGETLRGAVSQPDFRRHNGWINTLFLAFRRKERKPMLNPLMAIILSIALLLGSGASVYAAQASLPDQPLYAVKTWSEDARLWLAGSPQGELELTLDFTDRRLAEISALRSADQPVLGQAATRLQEELDEALQIAAGMDDLQLAQALEQIRQRAENQIQRMEALIVAGAGQNGPQLERIRERLQEQVRLAAAGQADPAGFRLQLRERTRTRLQATEQTPPVTPEVTPLQTGSSYGPGPKAGQMTGTPGQYGPGGPNPNQTPQAGGDGYGPGPGAGQPTEMPGGYGPGPQNGTCTPVQDGSGPGPGPQKPAATQQPGGPGSGPGNGGGAGNADSPGQGGKP